MVFVLYYEPSVGGSLLDLAHDTEKIAAPNQFEICLAEPPEQQVTREVQQLRGRGAAPDSTVAVKVCPNADMVDAGHVDHVTKMVNSIDYRRFAFKSKEAMIKRHLSHTACAGERPKLFVGQVARMVAQRPRRSM